MGNFNKEEKRAGKSFSVVIITLNEERNIERALRSVKDLTDDIVVIDSGSTDRTADICKDHGASVYIKDWEGYSATKNYGNSKAKYSWILSLDADEALSDELKKSILEHFRSDAPCNRVYSFNRLTNYCGKWVYHSGWYPDKKIRIWHRDHGEWEGTIHEKIKFNTITEEIKLKGDLLHYSYYTISDHWKQIDKYTTLSAEKLYREGKRVSFLKILFAADFRFLRDFIFRGGFLDGKTGYHVCKLTAWSVYLKYSKLRELRSTDRR